MTEFKAYKKLKNKVQKLVDEDKEAETFFNNLKKYAPEDVKIVYIDEIIDVLNDYDEWKKERFIIFATTIQISNQYEDEVSTHSILLIWNGNKLYLYDPNGAYNTEEVVLFKSKTNRDEMESFGYMLGDLYFDSTIQFKNYIKKNYSIELQVPDDMGAQTLLLIEGNSTYIHRGGYCMFFNYMVIEYILSNLEKPFYKIYKTITNSPFKNVFPPPATSVDALNGTAPKNTFEGKTVQIIEDVFNTTIGGNRKRKTKRKRKERSKTSKKK